MNIKHRYVIKYIAFRFVPDFLIIGILSASLILMAGSNNNSIELILAITISASALTILLAYYGFHIVNFLNMIKRQEKQYNTTFDDTNPKTFLKYPSWVICSNCWLISPGKFAIYCKEIQRVSVGEACLDGKRLIYPVKIKTRSGKDFKLKFKDEKDARTVRNWARR